MSFESFFPVWDKLNTIQRNRILSGLITRQVKKGTVIHNGSMDCTGLLLVKSGQLRAYILSEEGREITIYRLFDMDMCLFSASCMMRSMPSSRRFSASSSPMKPPPANTADFGWF